MKKFVFTAALAAALLIFTQTAFCSMRVGDYFVEDGAVTAYVGVDNAVLVPAEIDGEKIDKVAYKAFAGMDMEYMALEKGIKEVGRQAFAECDKMLDFQASSTLAKIDDEAFKGCAALETIELPNLDIQFGKDVFKDTGYLYFSVLCDETYTSDREKQLSARIAAAKGDTDFLLSVYHEYEYDGKNGGMICKYCGDEIVVEDGLEPGEDPYDGPFGPEGAPDVNFTDVAKDMWYYEYINIAAQFGLLNGKGDGTFKPDDNITVAEAAKIAACAREYFDNTNILGTMSAGENWYDKYFIYCKNSGIIEPTVDLDPKKPATRAEVSYLFSRCGIDKYFINEVPITDIPDVDYSTPYFEEILDMFDLGAAVGSDANYTFHPNDNIKRSEAAAMIVRIICYDLRIELPKG
ncbi:MAG: S-layer homology domain-containing protein [Firmicutes bacterium]|nr:S-layer homology domain-containing protein [Bacillota bacterium]